MEQEASLRTTTATSRAALLPMSLYTCRPCACGASSREPKRQGRGTEGSSGASGLTEALEQGTDMLVDCVHCECTIMIKSS